MTLIHDVLVRPCGFANVARLAPIWKALDSFGTTTSDWLPYWETPVPGLPDNVKASVYRNNGAELVIVSNLSEEKPAEVELPLPAGLRAASDARTGQRLPVSGGKVHVSLEPFRMRMVKMEK